MKMNELFTSLTVFTSVSPEAFLTSVIMGLMLTKLTVVVGTVILYAKLRRN